MNAREAMRRRTAKALAAPAPDTSHADVMSPEQRAEFSQAYAEAALGIAMAQAVYDSRTALGWTKAELARRASMDERMIRRIEDGARPATTPTLTRLGRALGGSFLVETGDDPKVTFRPTARPKAAKTAVRRNPVVRTVKAPTAPGGTRAMVTGLRAKPVRKATGKSSEPPVHLLRTDA